MIETEWFAGRSTDEPTPTWMDRLIDVLCMACLGALIALALPGCATTARDAEVCYIKPMGNSDGGLIVVLQQCMSPEAFQKAQE